jgi:hypothetical protein
VATKETKQEAAAAPAAPAVETFEAVRLSTKEQLDRMPKRKVRLRKAGPGETPLPDETVCLNGYIYQIQRGVEVEVPEAIYDILDEAGRI